MSVARYGYFLPLLGEAFGDHELSMEALRRCASVFYLLTKPGRYDGVSIWETDDGARVTRVCVQDFFSPVFRIHVLDLPPEDS